jgi:hypothetical protein
MGGHGQRPGIEPVDHSERVLKGSERSFLTCIDRIDIDPFGELRHGDPQINRGETNGRVSPANQVGYPMVTLAPEYLGGIRQGSCV